MKVIADNVGDNVGDIAGMGSDLFGSYAESSCAALFVASISSFGASHDFTAMAYPLLISSMGIIVCLITTFFATDFLKINGIADIEPSLKRQLLISTILMTGGIALVSFTALPSEFTIFDFGANKLVKNWYAVISFITFSYFTRCNVPLKQLYYEFVHLFCFPGTSSFVFRLVYGQVWLLDT